MPKTSSTTDEIQQIKARLKELESQQIDELRERRRSLASELASLDRQISEITGVPTPDIAATDSTPGKRKRATRIAKLIQDSDEYKEIGRKVQNILAKDPTGMNGKQISDSLGYTQLNERNRIKVLLNDNRLFKKTGQGVSTRFFLR